MVIPLLSVLVVVTVGLSFGIRRKDRMLKSLRSKMLVVTVSFGLFLSLADISFVSATETMTIDTYYPSPYGTYNMLRLYPHNNIDPNGVCSNKGELYFDDSDNSIYYCDGTNWIPVGTKSGLPQQQIFRNNGAFTIPSGIRKIKIKMWGGGGGGGRGAYVGMGPRVDGGDGGDTTFAKAGVSFTAYGGRGGIGGAATTAGTGGAAGGYSAGVNIGYAGFAGGDGNIRFCSPCPGSTWGGQGGPSGDSGSGGHSGMCNSASDPGGGGWGAWTEVWPGTVPLPPGENGGGGGGGGGGYLEHIFDVTPGHVYTVTVGVGGADGNSFGLNPCSEAKAGAKGEVIVEW